MIARFFQMLGRTINNRLREMGAMDRGRALRSAGLLLVGTWAIFLPIVLLMWFAVLRQRDLPYSVTVTCLGDSLLFVVACFAGVRGRLALSATWVWRLLLLLVALLFLPMLAVLSSRSLPADSAWAQQLLQLYSGHVFDVYMFSILGLLAGLHGHQESVLGGKRA